MTWFAIYEDATGRLESVGTVVADDAALSRRGLVKKALPDAPGDQLWDEVLRDFKARPVRKLPLSRPEFWRRFTTAEREAIRDLADNGTRQQRSRVKAFLDYLGMMFEVETGDPEIDSAVRALETAGALAPGRADQVLG